MYPPWPESIRSRSPPIPIHEAYRELVDPQSETPLAGSSTIHRGLPPPIHTHSVRLEPAADHPLSHLGGSVSDPMQIDGTALDSIRFTSPLIGLNNVGMSAHSDHPNSTSAPTHPPTSMAESELTNAPSANLSPPALPAEQPAQSNLLSHSRMDTIGLDVLDARMQVDISPEHTLPPVPPGELAFGVPAFGHSSGTDVPEFGGAPVRFSIPPTNSGPTIPSVGSETLTFPAHSGSNQPVVSDTHMYFDELSLPPANDHASVPPANQHPPSTHMDSEQTTLPPVSMPQVSAHAPTPPPPFDQPVHTPTSTIHSHPSTPTRMSTSTDPSTTAATGSSAASDDHVVRDWSAWTSTILTSALL
jgi:hypothetical protein